MQTNTQRYFSVLMILSISFMLFIQSCKKDDPLYPAPASNFINEIGYTSENDTLLLGETVKIKFAAITNSNVELTLLHISINKDSQVTNIDSGINTNNIIYEKTITKSTALVETWSFYVADRDGRKSEEISITFYLDPASIFGEITHVPSVIMGAQSHSTIGELYSFDFNQVYNFEDGTFDQANVNLVYYYDNVDTDANTIASPAANINTAIIDFSAWTTKNTVRFELRDLISESEYNASQNDSLILNNTFEFATGKRKAKNLATGNIYAFVSDTGEKGLFKVTSVSGQESGTIEISIKMQK